MVREAPELVLCSGAPVSSKRQESAAKKASSSSQSRKEVCIFLKAGVAKPERSGNAACCNINHM